MYIPSAPLAAKTAAAMKAPTQARGFLLDSARCQERPEYYRSFIDFAALRGTNLLLWHFTDDQGCSLQLDSVPEAASPHAYSKAQMRELVKYAGDRGIEIVPELASLGHSRYLTRIPAYQHLNEANAHFTGMCPVSDETRQIVRALIEETAEVFGGRNFHVGLDEVNIGGHPLTKAALQTQTRGDLLADYANFIHGVVTGAGCRMWMWGDSLLKHAEMLDRVPRDVVICNWQYTPDASPATTQNLLDAGFDVMLCSALISHDQPLFPGEQFALPNVRSLQAQQTTTVSASVSSTEPISAPTLNRGRILGHLDTIWTPVRFIADSLWLGVDLAAAVLRDGPDIDSQAQAWRFGENFYGLNGESASAFAETSLALMTDSPLRDEWLAVVKLRPLSEEIHHRVTTASGKWMRAYASLRKIAPRVQQHLTEYAAFTLLVEMLAHTYDAAVRMSDPSPSRGSIFILIKRGASLLERVDRNWDRERFADDLRKYTAPIASFQDDHLIPLLEAGLLALKERYDLAAFDGSTVFVKSQAATAAR